VNSRHGLTPKKMAHLWLTHRPVRLPKLMLILLTLAALLWPSRAESPVQALVNGAPAEIRIEHQLIHVVEAPPPPRRPAAAALNRLASVRKPVQRARQETLVVRAGRLLMGDGRFRPEPFPRPGQ
jgi:hypothetical protein